MLAALLVGMEGWYSTRCKLTWKLKGTKYNRLYFQLQVSALAPTEGTGFGLLPTVKSQQDCKPQRELTNGKNISHKTGTEYGIHLSQMAKAGLLPTPQAIDGNGTGRELRLKKDCNRDPNQPGSWRGDLKDYAIQGMLPTPATRDYKGARSTESLEEAGRNQTNSLPDAFAQPGKTSQLNPRFVLEMMGFPPDWTELPFLNGETNQ
jgi:hypothetical protein